MRLLKFLVTVAAAFLPCFAAAEVYQLTEVSRVESPSVLETVSPEQLVEKEKGKRFVITFLKASPEEKFRVSSEKFKRLNQAPDTLKKIFNKETYDTVDFQEVKFSGGERMNHLAVKANLHWFMEGYEGAQTVYFMLVKEKDRWMLDWLVY